MPSYVKQDIITISVIYDRENSIHNIPITQAAKLFVKFYPESTDLLVPNLLNKVYFETLSSPEGNEDLSEFESAELIIKDVDSKDE